MGEENYRGTHSLDTHCHYSEILEKVIKLDTWTPEISTALDECKVIEQINWPFDYKKYSFLPQKKLKYVLINK